MTGAEGRDVERSTRAVVDLGAIEYNVERVRDLVGENVEILAVVKADAYGHGAVETARACERAGAAALGVALVQEGVELRRAGIDLPILVLTLADAGEIDAIIADGLMPTVASLDFALELSRRAESAGATVDVHADVNTGMGRIGFERETAAEKIAEAPGFPTCGSTVCLRIFLPPRSRTTRGPCVNWKRFWKWWKTCRKRASDRRGFTRPTAAGS